MTEGLNVSTAGCSLKSVAVQMAKGPSPQDLSDHEQQQVLVHRLFVCPRIEQLHMMLHLKSIGFYCFRMAKGQNMSCNTFRHAEVTQAAL